MTGRAGLSGLAGPPSTASVAATKHNGKRLLLTGLQNVHGLYAISAHLTVSEHAIAKAGLSVRLSVRPSVTLVSYAYTVEGIEIRSTPYDRAMLLVSCRQILSS